MSKLKVTYKYEPDISVKETVGKFNRTDITLSSDIDSYGNDILVVTHTYEDGYKWRKDMLPPFVLAYGTFETYLKDIMNTFCPSLEWCWVGKYPEVRESFRKNYKDVLEEFYKLHVNKVMQELKNK